MNHSNRHLRGAITQAEAKSTTQAMKWHVIKLPAGYVPVAERYIKEVNPDAEIVYTTE